MKLLKKYVHNEGAKTPYIVDHARSLTNKQLKKGVSSPLLLRQGSALPSEALSVVSYLGLKSSTVSPVNQTFFGVGLSRQSLLPFPCSTSTPLAPQSLSCFKSLVSVTHGALLSLSVVYQEYHVKL